jgi:hypothetical protein
VSSFSSTTQHANPAYLSLDFHRSLIAVSTPFSYDYECPNSDWMTTRSAFDFVTVRFYVALLGALLKLTGNIFMMRTANVIIFHWQSK